MGVEEELQALVDWYKNIPESYKQYVAFRAERVREQWAIEQSELFKLAEKAVKLNKKHAK